MSAERPLSASGGKHSHWNNRAAEIEEAWMWADHPSWDGRRKKPVTGGPRSAPTRRTRAGKGWAK